MVHAWGSNVINIYIYIEIIDKYKGHSIVEWGWGVVRRKKVMEQMSVTFLIRNPSPKNTKFQIKSAICVLLYVF